MTITAGPEPPSKAGEQAWGVQGMKANGCRGGEDASATADSSCLPVAMVGGASEVPGVSVPALEQTRFREPFRTLPVPATMKPKGDLWLCSSTLAHRGPLAVSLPLFFPSSLWSSTAWPHPDPSQHPWRPPESTMLQQATVPSSSSPKSHTFLAVTSPATDLLPKYLRTRIECP